MSEQTVPPEDEHTQAERWARAHYDAAYAALGCPYLGWGEMSEREREAEIAAMLPLVREARAKAANMAADVGELRAALAFEKAWNKETLATVPRMERRHVGRLARRDAGRPVRAAR